MAVKNSLSTKSKSNFAQIVKSSGVQQSLIGTLGDTAKTKKFTASIVSAVSNNPALAECDAMTIISGALIGESLNLSPSPQLGQYYLVPFKDRKNNRTTATFQIGWKGYYQLALRTGQYKKLNVTPVKEGELVQYDPFNEEIELNMIQDEAVRAKAPTIGYYGMFELNNGFRKTMYWSKEKMQEHAKKYSQGYASDLRNNHQYTFWSKDFDAMAIKTIYRQLIGKYGIMSIEMETAYTNDMSYKDGIDKQPVYFDNEVNEQTSEVVEAKVEEVKSDHLI